MDCGMNPAQQRRGSPLRVIVAADICHWENRPQGVPAILVSCFALRSNRKHNLWLL